MASEPPQKAGGSSFPPDPRAQSKPWLNQKDTLLDTVDGTIAGRRMPDWMDPINGELSVLVMKHADDSGKLPDNPFTIRKSIENAVGAIEDARPEARGVRYILKVRQSRQIEKLMELHQLIDGTPIAVSFHESLNVRKCKVTCPFGLSLTDEELLADLKSQRAIEVKRFTIRDKNDKKKIIPTATMVVTLQGTIPEYLFFGYVRAKTQTYYPSPLQCAKCHKLGHTKRFCDGNTKCPECSTEHADTEPCPAGPHCVNCSGSHSARSRECSAKNEEIQVIKIKIDEDVSFAEARRRFEARKDNTQQSEREIQPIVAGLQRKLDEKDQEIVKLRKLLETLIKEVAELKKEKQQPQPSGKETGYQDSKHTKRRQMNVDYSPTRPIKGVRSSTPPKETAATRLVSTPPQTDKSCSLQKFAYNESLLMEAGTNEQHNGQKHLNNTATE